MNPHSLPLIRIFLSSPGDLTDERAIARKVIEQIGYDPAFYGKVTFEVVAWEQEGSEIFMPATLPPQEAINRGLPRPSECDLVIVMLWTRIGTPLPFPEYQKPDGTQYLSGTEYEYLDALKAAQQTSQPLVAVYQCTQKVMLDPDDPKIEDKLKQQRHVKAFFEAFRGPDGTLRQSYHQYETPEDFRTHFERALRRFVVDFQSNPTSVNTKPAAVATPPLWESSPFPGLRAFTPADAPIFFGRGRETDALIKQVSDSRFVAVVGASGSGKSSLVGAGLIPRLKDNAISGDNRGSKDWRIVSFKPGEKEGDPFRALADALVKKFPALIDRPLEAMRIKAEFIAALKAEPASLTDMCMAALVHDPAWTEILLFVDQFEELFTVVDESLRAPFVELLNSIAHADRLRIIVTMRADFYHACLKYKALEELLRSGTFPLGAPGQIALSEMITRPAERARLQWEDNYLPERILQDTGSEPGSLALMAYTLDELYRACKNSEGSMLTHAAYEQLGQVQGAIGTRAETAFEHLLGDETAKEHMLQRVFLTLVEVDDRGTATRRRAPKAQLLAIDGAAALVDYFAGPEVRLLVTSGDNDHAEVEVAHEALLRSWKRLADWIELTQDDQRLIRRIEREALEWLRRGKPDHMLPNAEELAEYHAALDRLGLGEWYALAANTAAADTNPQLAVLLREFTEPEADRLLRELDDIDTPHARRSFIGEHLCAIGDPRPGVSLRPVGLPDIVWCAVPGGEIEIKGGIFTVKPFYIAKYPITFIQFQAFLDDADGFERDEWWEGLHQEGFKQSMNEQRFKFANHPRDSVSWYQAVAFCRWLTAKLPPEAWPDTRTLDMLSTPRGGLERLSGKTQDATTWQIRLPTEWEWQYAATGGNPANQYPWGPEWEGRRANTNEAGLGRTTAVGMYPHGVSSVGALDMSGNVWEWCMNVLNDLHNIETTGNEQRALRGGTWGYDQNYARSTFNDYVNLNFWDSDYGFRVVCASPI